MTSKELWNDQFHRWKPSYLSCGRWNPLSMLSDWQKRVAQLGGNFFGLGWKVGGIRQPSWFMFLFLENNHDIYMYTNGYVYIHKCIYVYIHKCIYVTFMINIQYSFVYIVYLVYNHLPPSPSHSILSNFFATGTEQHFRTSVWVLGDLRDPPNLQRKKVTFQTFIFFGFSC